MCLDCRRPPSESPGKRARRELPVLAKSLPEPGIGFESFLSLVSVDKLPVRATGGEGEGLRRLGPLIQKGEHGLQCMRMRCYFRMAFFAQWPLQCTDPLQTVSLYDRMICKAFVRSKGWSVSFFFVCLSRRPWFKFFVHEELTG